LVQLLDGGERYDFVGWSDGGAASHFITTPGEATSYVAIYTPAPQPPEPEPADPDPPHAPAGRPERAGSVEERRT
jgi:hypothetical protein